MWVMEVLIELFPVGLLIPIILLMQKGFEYLSKQEKRFSIQKKSFYRKKSRNHYQITAINKLDKKPCTNV